MKHSLTQTTAHDLSQDAVHLPTSALVKRLVTEYVRPHAPRLFFALMSMFVVAATTAWLAKMMEPLLNDVFTRHDPQALQYVATMIFALFSGERFGRLWRTSLNEWHWAINCRRLAIGHVSPLGGGRFGIFAQKPDRQFDRPHDQ